MDAGRFRQACEGLGLALDDETLARFVRFEQRLYKFNESKNLTRVPQEDAWVRHFVDSLMLNPYLPPRAKVLDVGTGPGLPAWPLACARPDLKITALDSNGKMLEFLHENPLPHLEIIQERAEIWRVHDRFDVVTGRAVAPLTVQLEISAPRAKVGGTLIPMRTPNDLDLIRDFDAKLLGLELEEVHEVPLPFTDIVRVFPVFRKTVKTPAQFPRPWAEIRRAPLGDPASAASLV